MEEKVLTNGKDTVLEMFADFENQKDLILDTMARFTADDPHLNVAINKFFLARFCAYFFREGDTN